MLVREVLETVPLAPITATPLRMPILGIAGETDPQTPSMLYEQLRNTGTPIRIQEISGAGHGTCFSDPRFREAAIDFFAAQA
jgi:pimeloyl-ACP methyl ester carboxylesterase